MYEPESNIGFMWKSVEVGGAWFCKKYEKTDISHVCVMVTARHILHTGNRSWAGILSRV